MRHRRTLVAALFSSVLVHAGPAAADDRAQALFDQGVDLMDAHKFDQACPAIEESQRLDPRPGTLFALAECESQRGRFATAVARYDEYLAVFASLPPDKRAKQRDRDRIAKAAKGSLGPQIPELTLVLPPNAPRSLVIERDGVVVGQGELATPLLVDPGDHVVTTQTAGGPKIEHRITLAKGEKKQLDLTLSAPPAGEGAAPPPPPPDEGAPPVAAGSGGPSRRRVAAYASGGVGIAGLVLGGIMGGLAVGKKGVVDSNCVEAACNAKGKAAADGLETFGLVSTIGFGIGIAGLGAATVLLFTEPPRPKAAAARAAGARWVSAGLLPIGQAGVGLRGGW